MSDNEYQDVVTLGDGTTITQTTGRLVLSFTNTDTGFTIIRNVSGPSTEIDHPDGSATIVYEGESWFGFGPISQGNTGEPPRLHERVGRLGGCRQIRDQLFARW